MPIPGEVITDRALLKYCRDLVREVAPDATVILYGSRARGDAKHESDYDLLILTDSEERIEERIRSKLYPLELETGAVLSLVVLERKQWYSPLYQAMPFSQNIMRDGIWL